MLPFGNDRFKLCLLAVLLRTETLQSKSFSQTCAQFFRFGCARVHLDCCRQDFFGRALHFVLELFS